MTNNLCFTLNAHLPFVRHPEYPKFLEEDWFYEAVNESYLPLLRMFYRLRDEKVPFHIVFSLSPTLVAMFKDQLLSDRLRQYMESRLELGGKEIERLWNNPEKLSITKIYVDNLNRNLDFWKDTCGGNILSAFNTLSEEGYLELITTAATHAYLPIYKDYPVAVNAQLEVGIMQHTRTFTNSCDGFWLPANGYYPGLEDLLKRHNISWTELAAHSLFLSEDKPVAGNYAPSRSANGVYFFPRDYYLTSLVWSSKEGYPCDPCYREFYRDIGYDLPIEYVRPYIHEPDIRVFTGFKYWAITGNTADKVVYNPHRARTRVTEHANNFLYNVRSRGKKLENILSSDPFYTVSFDAELFGHFWYEGVWWLEEVIRLAAQDSSVRLITPGMYIAEKPAVQTVRPVFSSWGAGGYSQSWVDNSSNASYVPHVLEAMSRMTELAQRFPNQKSLKQRFLNQAAREALLLMDSDWLLLMHNHTNDTYSKNRIDGHIRNLYLVYDNMCKNAVNTEWLVKAEERNNIFPDIDYNIFNPEHLKEASPVYTTDFTAV